MIYIPCTIEKNHISPFDVVFNTLEEAMKYAENGVDNDIPVCIIAGEIVKSAKSVPTVREWEGR